MRNNPMAAVAPAGRAATRAPTASLLAFLVGALLLYVVGFAAPAMLHDAAHDTRHALAFPCH
jgi:cobalt transporter subunit CbtB